MSISYVQLYPIVLGLHTLLNDVINYCWDWLHEDLTPLGNVFWDNAQNRCFSEKQGDQGRFYYLTEYRISKLLSQNVKAKLIPRH